MEKEKVTLGEITLVGLTARTNNKNEMNPEKAKIGKMAGAYWGNQIGNKIKHRKNPGVTYVVYTEFESDENGEYTYFIGETVDSIDDQDLSEFKVLTIPESQYHKFTTSSGKMPDIVISAWQKIWAMKENDFEGKRKYVADFEVYDQRSADLNNAVIDIYIGIKT